MKNTTTYSNLGIALKEANRLNKAVVKVEIPSTIIVKENTKNAYGELLIDPKTNKPYVKRLKPIMKVVYKLVKKQRKIK
jgi:hypothetical protein